MGIASLLWKQVLLLCKMIAWRFPWPRRKVRKWNTCNQEKVKNIPIVGDSQTRYMRQGDWLLYVLDGMGNIRSWR